MNKIYLSDSGPKVSPAIYGFWRWSDEGQQSLSDMESMVNLCLELGINTFDHADIYGRYQSEELFGKVMKNKSFKREDIVLFTKCGLVKPDASRPNVRLKHFNSSAEHIIKSVDDSLKKLNTDYIDIFLLHHLDPLANLEETAAALYRLIESKKVKHIGISDFTVFQHQLLASYLRTPIVTSHIELNVWNTSAIHDGRLDFIRQKYTKPLAWAPLSGGTFYTGTDNQSVKVRKKLEEIGKKYNANIEAIAVAWLIKLGALPLLGTLDKDRIKNAISAFGIDLEYQDWYDLYTTSKGSL